MLLVLYGNEKYLIDDKINKAVQSVSEMGVSTFEGFTKDVTSYAGQYPFLDEKQIAIVKMPIIDKNEILAEYLDNPSETTDIYIIADAVDKRTALYKKLDRAGMLCECNKVNMELFEKFIMRELSRCGNKIDRETFDYFIQRCGYFLSEDITLYTVVIYLKQLGYASSDGIIKRESIDFFIPESVDQKSFALTKYLFQKNEKELMILAKRLIEEKENPIALLSLIERSFRLAYKATLYSELSEKKVSDLLGVPTYQFKDAMQYEPQIIEEAIDLLQKGVNQIKSGAADPGVLFFITLGSTLTLLKD